MSELIVNTNASEAEVVRAFKSAFFDAPTLADHFKPTPIAHFRSQMTWEPARALDCAAAAKLAQVNLNRTFEDLRNYRFELGETIALDYEPASDGPKVRLWVDNEPMVDAINVPSPIILHTYAHEIFTQLKKDGYTITPTTPISDYNVPAGAPPGWPLPS